MNQFIGFLITALLGLILIFISYSLIKSPEKLRVEEITAISSWCANAPGDRDICQRTGIECVKFGNKSALDCLKEWSNEHHIMGNGIDKK